MTKRERIAAYREAARMVAESTVPLSLFNSTLPLTLGMTGDLYCGPLFSIGPVPHLSKEDRVIALCLAAEMVRTGDL